MIKTSIVNIVVTAALGQRVDLAELGRYPQILHKEEIYGGRAAYFRSPKIRGEVTIFRSGKMISVGAKSKTAAFKALEYVKEFLIEKGFVSPVVLEKKVQNIVAVIDFFRTVNLEGLAETEAKIVYEPEQFPGAILRMEEPFLVTVLVYASGKAIIAGIKNQEDIRSITQKLEDIVQPYT